MIAVAGLILMATALYAAAVLLLGLLLGILRRIGTRIKACQRY
jgi:hypothetical protein